VLPAAFRLLSWTCKSARPWLAVFVTQESLRRARIRVRIACQKTGASESSICLSIDLLTCCRECMQLYTTTQIHHSCGKLFKQWQISENSWIWWSFHALRPKALYKCDCYYYFLTPVLNSQGMKKIRYAIKKVQKSNWNEPYSSSSFTKQSCSKMELYTYLYTAESEQRVAEVKSWFLCRRPTDQQACDRVSKGRRDPRHWLDPTNQRQLAEKCDEPVDVIIIVARS